jgi:hypothetical protein
VAGNFYLAVYSHTPRTFDRDISQDGPFPQEIPRRQLFRCLASLVLLPPYTRNTAKKILIADNNDVFDFENFDFVDKYSIGSDTLLDENFAIPEMRANLHFSFTSPFHALDAVPPE